jgi:NADH dehydrogenase
VFVGGGYAGVEALAELESMARDACRIYRTITPEQMRWVLVDAQDRLLPGLDPRLAQYTLFELRRRGIQVHLSVRMQSCENKLVVLNDPKVRPFQAGTIVWTAGQRPSPLTATVGFPLDDRGRIPVDRYVRVPGFINHFAVGDSAAVPAPEGGLCPPTAQHAMRQGKLAGRNAAADLGYGHAAPFRYRNRGLSVTLGQHRGTTQVRKLTVTGFVAWWMGRSYHLLMIPGLARRARVVTDWTIALLFPRDVSQLGQLGKPTPLGAEPPRPEAPTPSTPSAARQP